MRDYLRTHREEAEAYGRLKERLAEEYPYDIEGYCDEKDEFVKELERRGPGVGLRQIDLDKQKSVRFCAHSRRSAVASATNFLKRGVRIHSGAFLFNRERSFY